MLVCGRCFASCDQTPAMRSTAWALKASTALFLALSIVGLGCRDCPLLLTHDPTGAVAIAVMSLALIAALPMCWCLGRQLRSARCPACRRGWLSAQPPVHRRDQHGACVRQAGAQAGLEGPRQRRARGRVVAVSSMAIAALLWWTSTAVSLADAVSAPPRPQAGRVRPAWAAAAGDDRYGRWADLVLTGETVHMRWCPPGSFAMGCSSEEMEWAYSWTIRQGDEAPERTWFSDAPMHLVTLTRGFWLADTSCTQRLWQAVMGGNPATFTGAATLPMESVSWNDIQRFLVLAGTMAKVVLELPSESQWEYACRAGTTTRFSFGDDEGQLPRFANTADLDFTTAYSANRRFPALEGNDGYAETAPVGRFAPNPWGLYDMHGNVQQWCADWYAAYPPGSPIDPSGPGSGLFRVIRGGGWCIPASSCRSAERSWLAPGARRSYVGFRLCAPDAPP
jgi:sulfatase modifying factor 1